jgi:hypothetical protein
VLQAQPGRIVPSSDARRVGTGGPGSHLAHLMTRPPDQSCRRIAGARTPAESRAKLNQRSSGRGDRGTRRPAAASRRSRRIHPAVRARKIWSQRRHRRPAKGAGDTGAWAGERLIQASLEPRNPCRAGMDGHSRNRLRGWNGFRRIAFAALDSGQGHQTQGQHPESSHGQAPFTAGAACFTVASG